MSDKTCKCFTSSNNWPWEERGGLKSYYMINEIELRRQNLTENRNFCFSLRIKIEVNLVRKT